MMIRVKLLLLGRRGCRDVRDSALASSLFFGGAEISSIFDTTRNSTGNSSVSNGQADCDWRLRLLWGNLTSAFVNVLTSLLRSTEPDIVLIGCRS